MPTPPTTSADKESEPSPRRHRRLRWALWIGSVTFVILFGRASLHLIWTAATDSDRRPILPDNFVDDASRMNATQIAEVFAVPVDPAAAEAQLRDLLRRARASGLRVSIAGARHSMGGHTIYPGGIVIDMTSFRAMRLNESKDVLDVQAGAMWSEIIAYLDGHRRSVHVMQSNSSFTVGGSVSVNCHGWQYNRPPIASTVVSFRLMKADGTIHVCSRQENRDLFSLALGGYGLFGIILDLRLRVVANERYRLEQFIVPVDQALATFDAQIGANPDVAMVYARMGIVPDKFLGDVILNLFYRDPAADGELPALHDPGMIKLRRSVFRGSVGSDYGKQLRWTAETKLQPHLRGRFFSRNQLMNESVTVFENRSADSTDILHEYFVPRAEVERFVAELRRIVPAHRGDLLNMTVRGVAVDEDSFLRYADQPVYAFVMLFSQATSAAGDATMASMTQELIEAALRMGGRYYLPYRLHATPEQFHRAYPQAEEFFARKRRHDPDELFQNVFYTTYGTRNR